VQDFSAYVVSVRVGSKSIMDDHLNFTIEDAPIEHSEVIPKLSPEVSHEQLGQVAVFNAAEPLAVVGLTAKNAVGESKWVLWFLKELFAT
jgi:acyl-CoA thioesterase